MRAAHFSINQHRIDMEEAFSADWIPTKRTKRYFAGIRSELSVFWYGLLSSPTSVIFVGMAPTVHSVVSCPVNWSDDVMSVDQFVDSKDHNRIAKRIIISVGAIPCRFKASGLKMEHQNRLLSQSVTRCSRKAVLPHMSRCPATDA